MDRPFRSSKADRAQGVYRQRKGPLTWLGESHAAGVFSLRGLESRVQMTMRNERFRVQGLGFGLLRFGIGLRV